MYYYQTDKGIIRSRNEDNGEIFEYNNVTFMVVLDGMGGHNKGDTASTMALKVFKEKITKYKKYRSVSHLKRCMIRSIRRANKEVNVLGSSKIEYSDMGTTLITLALYKDWIVLCNIGDSRCYGLYQDSLQQISEDQTYVEFLYKTGKIKQEEKKTHPKRHILMNALGTYPSLSVATSIFKNNYQKLLLCSDGLYNMVENEYIEEILLEKELSTKEKVEKLIQLSNLNGGRDNIAIALWEEKI